MPVLNEAIHFDAFGAFQLARFQFGEKLQALPSESVETELTPMHDCACLGVGNG